jgi:tRNA (guanine6-N2)-methyltransferase
VQLLATTNPGLESVAAGEVADLVGADAERRYRGAVAFAGDEAAVYRLNRWSRTLHRVGISLVDRPFSELADLGAAVRDCGVERYVRPDLTFGVRASRHGTHGFTSVDVGDVTGGAVVDAVRGATGREPTVDLDDPDVILRAFVRDDEFMFAVDATGAESLHRRPYRECEHNAPLRPTVAAAMLRLAGFEPGDSLVDPTCGSATVPIEAALAALCRPPDPDRGYADERLPPLDPGGRTPPEPPGRDPDALPTLRGIDVRERWVRCGRVNARAAGVGDLVDVDHGDATEADLDADAVVANLPYGIRTVADDLATLYAGLSERVRAAAPRVAVLLTTRPDLLDLPVERTVDVRLGRLEAGVVVARP